MKESRRSRNIIPAQNPTNAGRNASLPNPSDCSIDGTRRLHTDAATMTPEANPVSARSTCRPILFFIRKTQADPRDVPRKGTINPIKIPLFISPPFIIQYVLQFVYF
jgi:hypothetical protein